GRARASGAAAARERGPAAERGQAAGRAALRRGRRAARAAGHGGGWGLGSAIAGHPPARLGRGVPAMNLAALALVTIVVAAPGRAAAFPPPLDRLLPVDGEVVLRGELRS